jgi:glycine dehydrogenase subunit 2
MSNFKQARWIEPIINEYSGDGYKIPDDVIEVVSRYIPRDLVRDSLNIPNLSEPLVVRHFIRLSQMNYSVDLGIYPLGSCTMKYNPKICDDIVSSPNLTGLHPLQPPETVQGLMEILYNLKRFLCMITGMDVFTLQPAAGAHGEYTGVLIIKKYHEIRGEPFRDEILIPDSAHGTNPASAKMAGFKVVEIPSKDGLVDIDSLREALGDRTAGMMLTNPNTLGLFEKDIVEIAKLVHEAGGLMYYDGANLNAISGIARPGDMGFDIVHVNLHKTFGTPHGGGGPGAGPVGVKSFLREFLPVPLLEYKDGKYVFEWDLENTIGKVHGFYGNIAVLVRAYCYILLNGGEGIRRASQIAVLNSNYLLKKLSALKGISIPYSKDIPRKHEFVISLEPLKNDTGITANDVAKRLLDYGLHPPTIYFPLIVNEAFMIEPTESVSKDDLDIYADVIKQIIEDAYNDPDKVLRAPTNTSVGRIDHAYGSRPRNLAPTYRWIKKFKDV